MKALGPIGMVRFVQSFDGNRGLHEGMLSMVPESMDEIFKKIKEKRAKVSVR